MVMSFTKTVKYSAIFGLLVGYQTAALAIETAAPDAYEIAAKSDRSDRGFESSEADMVMLLKNKAGAETTRELKIKILEVPDENVGDKSLIEFEEPADIKGTVLLSHAKILDQDDQWIYIPSIRRVKRISSANKSGPFMGSEFAYEDLTAQELNKYKYSYLDSEKCGDMDCYVIERLPVYENSGYSKQVVWIDKTYYQIRHIDYYDRKGEKVKSMEVGDYRQYGDKYWRPHKYDMTNLQTGKKTELIFSNYKFKNGFTDRQFEKGMISKTSG